MSPVRKGLALLIVVGVLGILAVLAAAFVTMAQLERRASRQRLNVTQARLLARSGLEDALARLSGGQAAAYGGEDWNGNGNPVPDPGIEEDNQVLRPGVCDVETCPARHALRPSFWTSAAGAPALASVDGRLRGYSGALAAGSYTLKV